MSADGPGSGWTTEVIAFLSENLPPMEGGGWKHMFSGSYEIGCGALIALGQADDTGRGAARRASPQLPDTLPRWDDICVAVLGLAKQQGRLVYYFPDGSAPSLNTMRAGDRVWTIRQPMAPPPVPPNIVSPVMFGTAASTLGPAKATPDVLSVLEVLGLIAEGCWTADAEPVLWRRQPEAWGLDTAADSIDPEAARKAAKKWRMVIAADPRFGAAVERAAETVPAELRAEIERLTTLTEKDVTDAFERNVATHQAECAKSGPKGISRRPTVEKAQRGLRFRRRRDLDWLFSRRWRLADGWLAQDEAQRALSIFHDPLAIGVGRAVVARLHPDRAEFAKFP